MKRRDFIRGALALVAAPLLPSCISKEDGHPPPPPTDDELDADKLFGYKGPNADATVFAAMLREHRGPLVESLRWKTVLLSEMASSSPERVTITLASSDASR